MICELDCNKKGTETLVQAIKWRPKIEGRTNNILMAICNDTVTEWHAQSSNILIITHYILIIYNTNNSLLSLLYL